MITIDGKDYKLEVNNGPNNLHSGPDLYHYRMWEQWSVWRQAKGSRLDFFLNSPDGVSGISWKCKDPRIAILLTEDSRVKIDYPR